MITFIAILFFVCLAVFIYLLLKGLKAGRDYDDRINDIMNGKHRYKYPKKS